MRETMKKLQGTYASWMASVKVCFAVGLLMTAFPTTVVGVTQGIPDDVVYTDVTKTLIRNNTGVLTCRFKGTPLALYWNKGSDPKNGILIASLHYGEKSGPRYEDGSCDIDDNYSLVIKRVRNEDTGRYTCRVVSYKGNLIQNVTDVTTSDTAVKTRSVVALQKGRPGVLPCEPIIRPKKISWLRRPNEMLVTMELSGNTPERSGPEYAEGLFNITKEYSLVIKDVMVMHEDRYVCEVADYDTDSLFQNETALKVFDFPHEPFPSIEGCPQEQQNLSACTLGITSRTTLTCQVEGYYPHIDLYFVHGSERVDSLETRVWNNSDGTKRKRVTISLDGSSDAVFECVAAGLVGQTDTRSITVNLIRDDQQSHVAVAVAVPVILVSAIIVIVLLVFKRRKTHFRRKIKRIPQTPSTCKVHHSHSELTLEHFSGGWMTMLWDWLFVRGKWMYCMPYLPNTMPASRKPVMELRLRNKPNQALVGQEYARRRIQPALDEEYQILIERKDLKITCDCTQGGHETKILKRSQIFRTVKCTVFFILDLQSNHENTAVTLKLTQNKTYTIMFDTGCMAPFNDPHAEVLFQESKVRDLVTDRRLNALSTHVPPEKYIVLSEKLGIEYDQAQNILYKHGCDSKAAIRECFGTWKNKTGGSLTELREILRSSELFGLLVKL